MIFQATILVILTISNTGRKWLEQGPDRGITVIEIFLMTMACLAASIRISLSNTKLRDRSWGTSISRSKAAGYRRNPDWLSSTGAPAAQPIQKSATRFAP